MLNTLIVLALMESAATEGSAIRCEFPGRDMAQTPMYVLLKPKPSLKDQPGLFRVMMHVEGRSPLKAIAQPIPGTDERDVLIRGTLGHSAKYTVGIRDDGSAAFNMQTRKSDDGSVNKQTWIGKCRGIETYINRWLPR